MCRLLTRSIVIALLVAMPAAADDLAHWDAMLKDSADATSAADYKRAFKISSRVVKEMLDELGTGPGAARALALAIVHRAAAQEGLGNHDDAVWDWQEANAIDPGIAKLDFVPRLGPVFESLENYSPPAPPESVAVTPGTAPPSIVAPKPTRRSEPCYPAGARAFYATGAVIVQTVIDVDGRVKTPRILNRIEAPTLGYCALEAVRRWTFTPAESNGHTVAVTFNLTMNFRQK